MSKKAAVTQVEKKLSGNKRFTSYKNTIEINPDFDGNVGCVIRKEDILGYSYEDQSILFYEYQKSKGYTNGSIDEWLKEEDFDESYRTDTLHSIKVLFSERIISYVDQFLAEKSDTRGEYIFYYDQDEVRAEKSDSVFHDDLKHLEDL